MSETQTGEHIDWTARDGSVTVRLARAVIPRMNVEVMRGFGVTRRRGTEVGGILVGRVESGPRPVIHIDDFEVVPCEYAFGPSYLLSQEDEARFAEAVARHGEAAVGYFRSHTREQFLLDVADAELAGRYFGKAAWTALLIRPFATRTAAGAWFLSAGGRLPSLSPSIEFPFSSEADAEPSAPPHPPASAARATPPAKPPHQSRHEPQPAAAPGPAAEPRRTPPEFPPKPAPLSSPAVSAPLDPAPVSAAAPVATVPVPTKPEASPKPPPPKPASPVPAGSPPKPDTGPGADRALLDLLGVPRDAHTAQPAAKRPPERDLFQHYAEPSSPAWRSWLAMVAFTLATLALGGVAGYQYGLNSNSPLRDPYDIGLFTRVTGDQVVLHWNQFAYPARIASKATLTVQEQTGSDVIYLSQPELRNGQMLLRLRSDAATFRLDVTLPDNRTVSNTLAWRR